MIEQIMYFLLGVLIATLFALLILPAVWHRAVRLTTRRVEAAVPVSVFEVQADKDQQRAAFAMDQRRLELQMDEMRAAYARQSHAVEENRLAAFEANRDLAALTEAHDTLKAYSEGRDATLAAVEQALAETSASLDAREGDLASRTAELESLTEAHKELTARAEALAADLTAAETSNAERAHAIALLETRLREEGTQLAHARTQLEAARADLHGEQERSSRLASDLSRTETALAAQVARYKTLEQTHLALATDLTRAREATEQVRTDLDANRAVLHAFEQSRAKEFTQSESEIRRLGETVAMLRADQAMMEDALKTAHRPQASGTTAAGPENGATNGVAHPLALKAANDRHRADDHERAVLKQALGEMAAEIVALAARQEGATSAMPELVAAPGINGTGQNGHDHPASSEIDLAGRIRALLDRTATGAPDAPAEIAVEPLADGPAPGEAAMVDPRPLAGASEVAASDPAAKPPAPYGEEPARATG